jgi:hypothetical protein
MAHQQGATQLMELPAIGHEREVMLVRLAKPNSRIKANPHRVNSRLTKAMESSSQVIFDVGNHI